MSHLKSYSLFTASEGQRRISSKKRKVAFISIKQIVHAS